MVGIGLEISEGTDSIRAPLCGANNDKDDNDNDNDNDNEDDDDDVTASSGG